MKDTSNFRTKTNFIKRNNGHLDGVWPLGLDLGYSAEKIFSPNSVARFPHYAKRVEDNFAYSAEAPKYSILYKDLETGALWVVGEVAQNLMSIRDTSDSESSLYSRDRYTSVSFRVIAATSLGVGMMSNEFGQPGDDKIVIQTGLPEKYMDDSEDLREALAGKYDFSLKVGNGQWQDFHFTIMKDDIFVMSQPKGTLFSISIDANGDWHPDTNKYLSSSIVFDAGFGTLDLYPITAGTLGIGETYTDLGMKRILQETQRGIKSQIGVDIPVPSMQKYLQTGTIQYMVDKKNFISDEFQFGDILADASKKVCEEAINRMGDAFDMLDYKHLIVTGGTGAAWYNQIVERFEGLKTLTIIKGNQNDDLPFVYANARGYYFYRFNKLANNE